MIEIEIMNAVGCIDFQLSQCIEME